MHVAIAIPSYDRWHATFGFDAMQLACAFTAAPYRKPPDGPRPTLSIHHVQSSYIVEGRQALVEECKAVKADWILWLDTDMRFPWDTLNRLLARDLPVVGANYITRCSPHRFTAVRDGKSIETRPESTGLEQVDRIGMGVVLTHIDVFRDDRVYFDTEWVAMQETKTRLLRSEDIGLCLDLAQRDYRIFVDHDLSKLVGHIGDFEFSPMKDVENG